MSSYVCWIIIMKILTILKYQAIKLMIFFKTLKINLFRKEYLSKFTIYLKLTIEKLTAMFRFVRGNYLIKCRRYKTKDKIIIKILKNMWLLWKTFLQLKKIQIILSEGIGFSTMPLYALIMFNKNLLNKNLWSQGQREIIILKINYLLTMKNNNHPNKTICL